MKGWLHCLTSESKGRFIVNKITLMSGQGANPIFVNKKIRFGRPHRWNLPPPPLLKFARKGE